MFLSSSLTNKEELYHKINLQKSLPVFSQLQLRFMEYCSIVTIFEISVIISTKCSDPST